MGVITELLDGVDAAASSIGTGAYGTIADAVVPIAQTGSVLIVIITGINLMIQAVPMTLQNGLSLMVRVALVFIFLTSFSNFNAVYGVLTNAPSEIGAVVLTEVTGGAVTNLYDGLDDLYGQALNVGDAVSQNGSFIAGAIAGVVMFLVAALMAVASIILIAGSKLMIGVLIILGPIAITTTLFKQTAPIFEAYVKLALGFALIPLLTAAMAGFTILAAQMIVPASLDTVTTIGDIASFIVVMLLGAGLMAMVPSVASGLAQTGIGLATAGAVSGALGRSGMRSVGSAGSSVGRGIGGAVTVARGQKLSNSASRSTRVGAAAASKVAYLANRMRK